VLLIPSFGLEIGVASPIVFSLRLLIKTTRELSCTSSQLDCYILSTNITINLLFHNAATLLITRASVCLLATEYNIPISQSSYRR
jgi:hypothetical protein